MSLSDVCTGTDEGCVGDWICVMQRRIPAASSTTPRRLGYIADGKNKGRAGVLDDDVGGRCKIVARGRDR